MFTDFDGPKALEDRALGISRRLWTHSSLTVAWLRPIDHFLTAAKRPAPFESADRMPRLLASFQSCTPMSQRMMSDVSGGH